MGSVEDKLTESARDALLEIAERLAEGYTGTIVLECNQGGVGNVQVTYKVDFRKKGKKGKHLTT